MRNKYEIHHRKMFALIFLHRFRSNEMLDVLCLGAKRRWLPIRFFLWFSYCIEHTIEIQRCNQWQTENNIFKL